MHYFLLMVEVEWMDEKCLVIQYGSQQQEDYRTIYYSTVALNLNTVSLTRTLASGTNIEASIKTHTTHSTWQLQFMFLFTTISSHNYKLHKTSDDDSASLNAIKLK